MRDILDKLNEVEKQFIAEERREDLKYEEKKVKNKIDKVIVYLEGRDSAKYTRLANQFKKIDRLTKKLNEKKKELNEEVKKDAEALFDAEDEVYTRVMETASLTVTIGKKETKTYKSFDAEGFIEELQTELAPELADQIKELVDKYTDIQEKEVSPKLSSVKTKDEDQKKAHKKKTKEGINEGISEKIREYAKAIKDKVMSWAKQYDKKLNDLKQRVENA